ncbi:2-hydroxychromene-2-carboxylate isomerase [Bradyrhizobium jicamae]|uniref:2-hydroxychromene-2-carboxylate isomerase n=1 Tax=Bradyrhizobium jicamae TaxID=280332 RepID=UPI001BA580C1|nr:2-hydroxychromene-2-carboxylate isomerase [Bradyrhizobium jicamae]MBR0756265.1 2-hydroxychromene-2-carboxylate isomerase [Bradyrhizobium jicamae]
MRTPLRFYFDFASPYAYFALRPLEALAEKHGRKIECRPILLWAVLKAHGIAAPLDAPVKRAYLMADMVRSAGFYGAPYRHPAKLPVSSHLAARLCYAVAEQRPEVVQALIHAIFEAFFVRGEDISRADVIRTLAMAQDLDMEAALEAMEGQIGRRRLAAAVDLAIAENVCGSPYVIVDGEGFFGADRLPQIAWRLSQSASSQELPEQRSSS